MRVRRFEWEGAKATAAYVREWTEQAIPDTEVEVRGIGSEVEDEGDEAVLRLTAKFDATDSPPTELKVDPGRSTAALAKLDVSLRATLELAATNIRQVAEAQLGEASRRVELAQGQVVTVGEAPVGAAGLYAPGGRAVYPSSVLMCAIPAQVAGVARLALASPPGSDGSLNPLILATAALCGIEEIYAMGGAQAIFALAYGTETIDPVDVVAGPGNAWVREAKWRVSGSVGIDSLAGPSELMAVTGPETDPEWAALDLCAQAEHGVEGPLLATAESGEALERLQGAAERAAAERAGIGDSPLALVLLPGPEAAVELANAFAPEHLQLFDAAAVALADRIATAGCTFVGPYSATAFGDYIAGSNHVLPTSGAGRFSGPLGPRVFRRQTTTVEVPPSAAAKLAPHVDLLARAEELPVHGESAMIRTER